MNETDAISCFRKSVHGMVIKLHGNAFQSLLPDTIWIDRGVVKFLEFKIIDKRHVDRDKWRAGQHAMLKQMLRNGADAWYCIYSREEKGFFMVHPKDISDEASYDIPATEPLFTGMRRNADVTFKEVEPTLTRAERYVVKT